MIFFKDRIDTPCPIMIDWMRIGLIGVGIQGQGSVLLVQGMGCRTHSHGPRRGGGLATLGVPNACLERRSNGGHESFSRKIVKNDTLSFQKWLKF